MDGTKDFIATDLKSVDGTNMPDGTGDALASQPDHTNVSMTNGTTTA